MIKKIEGLLTKSIIVGLLLYFLIFALADADRVLDALAHFNLSIVLLSLLLVFTGYFIRMKRWSYLLSILKVRPKMSRLVFFSGLSMTITPGKIGEFLKCLLLKRAEGVDKSKTAPVVVMERLGDLIGFSMLLLLASPFFIYKPVHSLTVVSLVIVAIFIFLAVLTTEWFTKKIESITLRITGKKVRKTRQFQRSMKKLFNKQVIAYTAILGAASWFLEGTVLWLIVSGFGFKVPFMQVISIFSLCSLLSGISMIPGGFGVIEGGLYFFLSRIRIPTSSAVGIIVIFRLCTLWFAILLGAFSLQLFERNMKTKNRQK